MRYEKIAIENFRGIKKATFDDLSNINIILGDNNCGKTSILEAVYTAVKSYKEMHYISILDGIREVSRSNFDFSYLFHKHNYDNVISIKLNNNVEVKIRRFDLSNYNTKEQQEKIKLNYRRLGRNIDEEYIPAAVIEYYIAEEKVNEIIYSKNGYHFEDFTYKHQSNAKLSDFKSLFLSNTKEIKEESFNGAEYIIEKRLENSITKILKKIDSNIEDWTFGGDNSILIGIKGETYRRPIDYMGDGFKKIFSILTSIHYCENGIICIDEIENGLHYKTIDLLISALYEYVKNHPKTQLFITTHSIDFLKSLNKFIKDKEQEEYFSIYTMKKQENDTINVYRSDKETIDNYLSTNSELR